MLVVRIQEHSQVLSGESVLPEPPPPPPATPPQIDIRPLLKQHLQGELNLSGIPHEVQDLTRILAPRRRIELRVRKAQVGMVEDIEKLRPELQLVTLTNLKILEHGKVKIHEPGSRQAIPASIAKRIDGGRISRRIKPFCSTLVEGLSAGVGTSVGVTDDVRPDRPAGTSINRGIAGGICRRERRTSLGRCNTVQLPASEESIHHRVGTIHESLALPHGQFVKVTHNSPVCRVPIRGAAFCIKIKRVLRLRSRGRSRLGGHRAIVD